MTTATATSFDVTAWPHESVPCNLCGGTDLRPVATVDRYGLPTTVVACAACGLRFITPRMTAEGYAAFYRDGYRPLLDRLMGTRHRPEDIEPEQWLYAANLLNFLTPVLAPHAGGHVLDVGGSTGVVGRLCRARWGYDVTVIDPSPEELAHARGCATICAPAETAVFPQADVALLCRTVDHLLDPKGVLTRLRAAAGLLVVDAMDVDHWTDGWRYKVDHPYAFTRATLRALVRAAGWAITREWTTRHDKYVGLVCSPEG